MQTHIYRMLFILIVIVGLLGSACTSGPSSATQTTSQSNKNTTSFTSSSGGTTNAPILYSSSPRSVLLRTFYGGGLYGSLEISPQVSIYGDGTYILGTEQQGTLSSDALQQLLHTLVDTYGLLSFQRRQFSDIADQNATFLEIAVNGKQQEFMYGSFGNTQESQQDIDEYHRLNQALTALNDALRGPTHPYTGATFALLARQMFSPDYSKAIPYWPLSDFTLAQAAVYVCGDIPQDDTSINAETGCLKYLKPLNAIALNAAQLQTLRTQLGTQLQGTFIEQGRYYTVILRPLLPDEISSKMLAMFGSAQDTYSGVPLLTGTVPPVPTPTPSH